MTSLQTFRKQLKSLRRRRRLLRWGAAWSTVVISCATSLIALFLVDVWLHLSTAQRVALMAAAVIGVSWACRRWALPSWGKQETEMDVALLVERQHGIDTDLVAALQFERPGAEAWGSLALERAVVSQVSDTARRLDVFRGLDYQPFTRRAKWAASVLVACLLVTVLYPRHVSVFVHRLLLDSRHYPGSTHMESVWINRVAVWENSEINFRPRDSRSAQGQPLRFFVEARGKLPDSGVVICRAEKGGESRTLELRRVESQDQLPMPDKATVSPDTHWYQAEFPRLRESIAYSIQLGDAWTEPARIRLVELPAAEVFLGVVPPAYARSVDSAAQPARPSVVLEGSTVQLTVQAANKPLESARVNIRRREEPFEFPLSRRGDDARSWSLDVDASPFDPVTDDLTYEVQVVDVDGLELESPLRGYLRMQADRPPTATTQTVNRVVLPSAAPLIEYRLADDYGIAAAAWRIDVERSAGEASSADAGTAATPLSVRRELILSPRPIPASRLPLRGQYVLQLGTLNLQKGDRVQVTLEVTDDRGESPGRQFAAEPLVLEVSDEAGVLAAITESDPVSEKQLDEIIQKQLNAGSSP